MILRNRILAAGFEGNQLDLLTKIDGPYLFIAVTHSNQIKQSLDKFEGLLITESFLASNPSIISSFANKPIFIYSMLDKGKPYIHLPPPLKPEKIKEKFDQHFKETRQPDSDTGEIKAGLVVKNKVFPAWGLGVVMEDVGEGMFMIKFAHSAKLIKKEMVPCHRSLLRVICTLEEIKT